MTDHSPENTSEPNLHPQTSGRPGLARQFLRLLMHNKRYWLVPLVLAILAIGALLVLETTAAAPFIYTLF